MINVNITRFWKDIINYNEPINVSIENGNFVILVEEDYNNLI